MPSLVTTRPVSKVSDHELAVELNRRVVHELEDRYGLYIASDDKFDLTEDNELILVNGMNDTASLPFKTSHRIATYVAATFYLRDGDGAA